MNLTIDQQDALTELINIGYGRAAAALSELTGFRVYLDAPSVALYMLDEVKAQLDALLSKKVACVNQAFSGPIGGNAMLLLDEAAAVALTRLLDERSGAQTLDSSSREVVTEAGNIILNACLGAFGNLLEVQVRFAVPHLQLDTVPALLGSIRVAGDDLAHALLMQTRFRLKLSNITGYITIILGFTSLERVLEALEDWERR